MQDATSSIYELHNPNGILNIPDNLIIIISYQLLRCLSHSEFRIAEYATTRIVTINQGRIEMHT